MKELCTCVLLGDGTTFHSSALPLVEIGKSRSLAIENGCPALQIGQLEISGAISSIGGAKQGEQGCVRSNGQYLAIAESPACRSEVEREYLDLADKGDGIAAGGENALQGDAVIQG